MHTPGPWTKQWFESNKRTKTGHWFFVSQSGTRDSKNVYLGGINGESVANATLIEAAPDLLAACEAALQRCEDAKARFVGRFVGDDELMEQLSAAIAKAKAATK